MRSLVALLLLSLACRSAPTAVAAPQPDEGIPFSTPSREGLDPAVLSKLVDGIAHAEDAPLFSLLISRHGKLVFELYTSSLTRDDAHYVMSVTKSFTSAAVGVAVDRGILSSADAPLDTLLPPSLFAASDAARFHSVTLREVLGMSVLYAPVPPHQLTPEAKANQAAFLKAPNRAVYALTRPLVAAPGKDFFYTDMTPMLSIAAVSYATNQTVFDFEREALFEPMGFKNEEWMHPDPTGLDNGAYGFRVRPIDMQKLGVLYLHGGAWNGRQLLSRAWVDQSFTPWIASKPGGPVDYGWGWWQQQFNGHVAHVANGWRGQRIAVFPDLDLVVTMTGDFPDSEDQTFRSVLEKYVLPAVNDGQAQAASADLELQRSLDALRTSSQRIGAMTEWRMVPGWASKERHRPFHRDVP